MVVVLSLGFFISVLAKNQFAASQIALLITFLPAFLLSGFLFSIEQMPVALQWITRILPARYYVSVLKKIFLKGTPTAMLYADLIPLAVFALRAGAGGYALVSQEAGVKERRRHACAPEADADQGVHPGFPRQAHALYPDRASHHPDAGLRLRGHLRNPSRAHGGARSGSQPGEPRTDLALYIEPLLRTCNAN